MANTKPLVTAACVCEKVLQEKDNVPSIIRIVDTFFIQVPPEDFPKGVQPQLAMTAFVYLRAGDLKGSFEIGLVLRSPSGKTTPVQKWPVVFQAGNEEGANLTIAFGIAKPELEGGYWFDVLWKDQVLTSIPFKVRPLDEANAPLRT